MRFFSSITNLVQNYVDDVDLRIDNGSIGFLCCG